MADRVSELLETPQAERLATGFVFTEGPLWHPDGFYYFVDIRKSELHRFVPGKGPELLRANTGEGNGTTFDLQGRLVVCEGGNRRVTRWAADGRSEILVDRYEGKRLNRPNDVVCRSDGSIYFTDPGLRVPLAEREVPHAGVYRVMPDGAVQPRGRLRVPERAGVLARRAVPLRRQHALGAVHPRARAGRRRHDGPPPHLRRHVVGRDRGGPRRHEGRRRGPRLLHGPGRHVGLHPRRHAARHHPHAGGARRTWRSAAPTSARSSSRRGRRSTRCASGRRGSRIPGTGRGGREAQRRAHPHDARGQPAPPGRPAGADARRGRRRRSSARACGRP